MSTANEKDQFFYYTVRVPIRRFGPDLVPAKYFLPFVVLFFVFKDHGYPKPTSIAAILIAFGIWFSLAKMARSIGPLQLKKNGDFAIPFAKSAAVKTTTKSSVTYLANGPYGMYGFLDTNMKVLATLRPRNFEKPNLIEDWVQFHYGSLPRLSNPNQWDWRENRIDRQEMKVGTPGFYPILIGLLVILAAALTYIIRTTNRP